MESESDNGSSGDEVYKDIPVSEEVGSDDKDRLCVKVGVIDGVQSANGGHQVVHNGAHFLLHNQKNYRECHIVCNPCNNVFHYANQLEEHVQPIHIGSGSDYSSSEDEVFPGDEGDNDVIFGSDDDEDIPEAGSIRMNQVSKPASSMEFILLVSFIFQ
ncbi:hypothetical protein LWI29_020852 [Acer saccharum]|uniref:C2H2-type domain-containing protein n=1 Tax=Acer saccharum TaxID=4024 RepID=A0AA39VNN7_ACESA|nr:hypothetical protein LWI29_020852 [Acer saccharum]